MLGSPELASEAAVSRRVSKSAVLRPASGARRWHNTHVSFELFILPDCVRVKEFVLAVGSVISTVVVNSVAEADYVLDPQQIGAIGFDPALKPGLTDLMERMAALGNTLILLDVSSLAEELGEPRLLLWERMRNAMITAPEVVRIRRALRLPDESHCRVTAPSPSSSMN